MLAEGVNPVSIEQAAAQNGSPVGPLAVNDEIHLELVQEDQHQATRAGVEAAGGTYEPHPAEAVIDTMIGIAALAVKGDWSLRLRRTGRPRPAGSREGRRPFCAGAGSLRGREGSGRCSSRRWRPRSASRRASITSAAAANMGSDHGHCLPPNTAVLPVHDRLRGLRRTPGWRARSAWPASREAGRRVRRAVRGRLVSAPRRTRREMAEKGEVLLPDRRVAHAGWRPYRSPPCVEHPGKFPVHALGGAGGEDGNGGSESEPGRRGQ